MSPFITAFTMSVTQLCANDGAVRRVVGELEPRRDPRDGRKARSPRCRRSARRPGRTCSCHSSVVEDVVDPVVGVPEVAGLSRHGGVEAPSRRPTRVSCSPTVWNLKHVSCFVRLPVLVLHEHEHVVADRVASPALELLAAVHRARADVLRVVDRAARLPGDEEEVVRVRGPERRRVEVVRDRVLPRPVPVVGELRARGTASSRTRIAVRCRRRTRPACRRSGS